VTEHLHGDGVAHFIKPGRIVFITPNQTGDLLWCAEEALRSGSVTLVVADLAEPPGLTPVRRLQLAAETRRVQEVTPLGLILTPEGAAPGVESRWAFSQTIGGWHLERQRARTVPPAAWRVDDDLRLLAQKPTHSSISTDITQITPVCTHPLHECPKFAQDVNRHAYAAEQHFIPGDCAPAESPHSCPQRKD
jgi:hypothetical protein